MVIGIFHYLTSSIDHHYADLAEGIELLKCFSDIFSLECVSRIRMFFSITFPAIYVAVCIPLTHFAMMIVRILVRDLSITIKSEVWPICHCIRLGHETMVCAVYLSIFLYIVNCDARYYIIPPHTYDNQLFWRWLQYMFFIANSFTCDGWFTIDRSNSSHKPVADSGHVISTF